MYMALHAASPDVRRQSLLDPKFLAIGAAKVRATKLESGFSAASDQIDAARRLPYKPPQS
jgi:hypothetical protein